MKTSFVTSDSDRSANGPDGRLGGLDAIELSELIDQPEPGHLVSERTSVIVAGGILSLIAIGYLVQAIGYPLGTLAQPGPGIFPLGIGVLFVAASVGVVVEAVRSDRSRRVSWPYAAFGIRLGLVLIASIAYIVLLPVLGQLICGGALSLAMLVAMRSKYWWLSVVISVVLTVAIVLVFDVVLGVPLPPGILSL